MKKGYLNQHIKKIKQKMTKNSTKSEQKGKSIKIEKRSSKNAK
jgi:hypothetical protein|tara:strand:- start:79 stop:207 length:129 start_codon:yes stop_codon:yes gene_type:complete